MATKDYFDILFTKRSSIIERKKLASLSTFYKQSSSSLKGKAGTLIEIMMHGSSVDKKKPLSAAISTRECQALLSDRAFHQKKIFRDFILLQFVSVIFGKLRRLNLHIFFLVFFVPLSWLDISGTT